MKKILLITLLMSAFSAFATDYYSTRDGNWTDVIWSTVGHDETSGLLALPCTFNSNDRIFIKHDVVCNCPDLTLGSAGGAYVEIFSDGRFELFGNLVMRGTSEFNVYGFLMVYGDIDLGGTSILCGTGTIGLTGTAVVDGNATWCSSLPIELATFSGKWSDEGVVLYWATASESNNSFFTVERCLDAQNFSPIAELQGAGNSSSYQGYEYVDRTDLSKNEWVYYRIKQTDFDGKFSYSNTIAVEPLGRKGFSDISLFPNPASDYFSVNFTTEATEGEVIIYNGIGQQLSREQFNNKGHHQLRFDASRWEPGTYIVSIFAGQSQLQQRVLIAR